MARLSRVLGPDGERVDLDALFGPPQAGPAVTGWRSPIASNPALGLTPQRLAQILRAAETGSPRAYLELAEDIEEREPQYLTVLGTRRRQVAQLPIEVRPASEDAAHVDHAAFVREFLEEGLLDLALFDMLDAISKGFSVTEIEWETLPDRIAPKTFTHRPARWFTFAREDGETLLLDGSSQQPLVAHKFVVHRHKAKSGLTTRGGLARPVAFAWMFKAFTARDWALFVQNYGQPLRIGKFNAMATEADKAALWRALSNIAGDCAAMIPAGMEIEFVETDAPAGSSELFLKRVEYFDRMISKIVLGQTTTTDAVSGGHAVAQEHRLVQEDIERADAKVLAASLIQQLVQPMVAFNFGPQDRYPNLRIGHPDELPIGEFVDGVDKMVRAGLRVKAAEVRRRLGVTEPQPGDEVLGESADAEPEEAGARPRPSGEARAAGGGKASNPAGGGKASNPAGGGKASNPAGGGKDPKPAGPGKALHNLLTRHAAAIAPEDVAALTDELARDAEAALAGLTGQVRDVVLAATSMTDLYERLDGLQLEKEAFAEALQRGLALAHLAGGAALLDELASRSPRG